MVSLDITNRWRQLTRTFAGSDVIYLNILGQGIIVLDSSEAIMDLLERRSSIYSDRPKVPMIRDLMGFDFSLPMVPYGKFRIGPHSRTMLKRFLPGNQW